MLTLFGDTVLPSLELIFKSYFESGTFASEYIKANLIPVHKKDDKQTLKNYRPISLLPLWKIFKLTYNKIFECFIENNNLPPSSRA